MGARLLCASPSRLLRWCLTLGLLGATTSARAQGWVGAFSELRSTPGDANDEHRTIAERIATVDAFGRYGPQADAVAALLEVLKQKPPAALREAVLLALARRAPIEATARLVALSAQPGAPTPALVLALAEIGTESALSALVALLARPEAATIAEHALVRAGQRAVVPLVGALQGSAGLAAARALAELGPAASGAFAGLVRSLQATAPERRALAAEALGRLGDPGAVPALLARLSDARPEVVDSALIALARLASAGASPAAHTLHAYLARPSTPMKQRALALKALAVASPTLAIAPLTKALRGKDALLREAALEVLEGDRPDPRWTTLLAGIVRAELGESSASALARVQDGRGVAALTRIASTTPDAALRTSRALAIALRRFAADLDHESVQASYAVLRSLEPGERRLLLRALARDGSVLDEAKAALVSPLAYRRAAGACAITWLGDIAAQAAPTLLNALAHEPDPEAARRMLETAASMRLRVGLGVLGRHLTNPETEPEALLLLAAGAADSESPSRELGVLLRRALSSPRSARTRAAAALALGVLGDLTGLTALEAALSDGSARVRLAAARALGVLRRLGSNEAAQTLAEHAHVESDALVRAAMLEAATHVAQGGAALERMLAVLEVRVVGQDAAAKQPPIDVLLQDGRWRRFRPLPGGELLVADLPVAEAEVRAVD